MLEITSHFKISLDLFEMATFGTNYGLLTADKAIAGGTKVALPYFSPLQARCSLEIINTLIFFSEILAHQNTPGEKAQWSEIRRFW